MQPQQQQQNQLTPTPTSPLQQLSVNKNRSTPRCLFRYKHTPLYFPITISHICNIQDSFFINQNSLKHPQNESQSFLKTIFYFKSISYISVSENYITLHLKKKYQTYLPKEYFIQRFKSYGNKQFYQIAIHLEHIAQYLNQIKGLSSSSSSPSSLSSPSPLSSSSSPSPSPSSLPSLNNNNNDSQNNNNINNNNNSKHISSSSVQPSAPTLQFLKSTFTKQIQQKILLQSLQNLKSKKFFSFYYQFTPQGTKLQQIIISKTLLSALEYDYQDIVIDFLKYQSALFEIISTKVYSTVMEKKSQRLDEMFQIMKGKVLTTQQIKQITMFRFNDDLLTKSNYIEQDQQYNKIRSRIKFTKTHPSVTIFQVERMDKKRKYYQKKQQIKQNQKYKINHNNHNNHNNQINQTIKINQTNHLNNNINITQKNNPTTTTPTQLHHPNNHHISSSNSFYYYYQQQQQHQKQTNFRIDQLGQAHRQYIKLQQHQCIKNIIKLSQNQSQNNKKIMCSYKYIKPSQPIKQNNKHNKHNKHKHIYKRGKYYNTDSDSQYLGFD